MFCRVTLRFCGRAADLGYIRPPTTLIIFILYLTSAQSLACKTVIFFLKIVKTERRHFYEKTVKILIGVMIKLN